MAMNYGFNAPYYGAYPQMNMNVQQPKSDIIWVQGEAGAKSYLVAPNTTTQLWDSEAPVIYLKSADASGMPSMKVIDYTIRNASQTSQEAHRDTKIPDMGIYATKDDLEALIGKFEALQKKVDGLKPATRKKDVSADE